MVTMVHALAPPPHQVGTSALNLNTDIGGELGNGYLVVNIGQL